MIRVENSITINADRSKVFTIASDFESWPKFMPQYSEVKIVEREGNRMVIERKGTVRGKEVFWRSETEVRAPNMIKSKQVVGPIPDMEIVWEFEAREKKTYIRLIHRFEYKKIPVIGGLIGRLIVARIVKKMAQETLEAVKKEAESV